MIKNDDERAARSTHVSLTSPLSSIIPDTVTGRERAIPGLKYDLGSVRSRRSSTCKPTPEPVAAGWNTPIQRQKRRYEQYTLLARESAQAVDRIETTKLNHHVEHYDRAAATHKAGDRL